MKMVKRIDWNNEQSEVAHNATCVYYFPVGNNLLLAIEGPQRLCV
jgi:hypothetical protein